ncbi:BREX-1 system adenine-specific DNA-methyltransferase PglX [Shewanella saliphila]|uniref:site-specific DNA-methyltransferase (adenine-specific) n=1 Tax=Shewanella saliphila TaxID=2282698 RepID=A0ABQ2QCC3_9GAMM|nr:BREX-1 system adenine-specific DNA-methyltransferase PglX [Shewanella saliphila]MCL1103160.1 BREX-1 system adenine-specific DNA-methyltransferase PglX [Shewanella saliphila]GGP66828.1 hypothetical protein GCM10009409_35020 [Shewanella saliphila]
MAFDQSTRNRLNRFVADSRGLLATEFTRQLQATYGMNPITGEIANINSLAGLTPHQQETAQLLRDTFEHYLAANDHSKSKSKEKEHRLAALDRIVREQAFTVLNRLAALRMSEARGFLTESLANGYDSKGFQLFHRIAGISLGETGEAYTHYLFSIFDEFALDLSVLFDRFSAQGRLFPSTPVLLELLALINHDEVAPLWAEDETIGWIYQYFNSQEERKKMRDASQAPRNSRELAVRNQFFTPRYVVEFLTDNTLGRIWYEMTKGQTKLVDECEYLVKRPNEVFLTEGEDAPEQEQTQGLSQEELLQQTVYIEHRGLKDPREIKMLDPACGSMHFGLYCFDLFERIYDEAWDIEAAQGADVFVRENNQPSLMQSYHDKAEFLTHVPRLIIENNIHGVDIDPRATQVAGMSLWQRAHNSWQQAGIKPQLRPQITKSNIVCAEPMPGEKELLQEFTSQLKPTVLGQLVEVIFDKMQLAGEAGTLLKIEKEIEDAITGAKAIWQQQNQALSQFPDLAKVAKRQNAGKSEVDFDVSDIDDESFWLQAEQRILDALSQYANSTSSDMTEQKRLFASDAAKGFAFIDLCKKKFDVILMNPPFGAASTATRKIIELNYPTSFYDLFGCFVDRGSEKLTTTGLLGCLSSRTGFYLSRMEKWRTKIAFSDTRLTVMADLGLGVLDDAMVETAAYVVSAATPSNHKIHFFDLMSSKNKNSDLISYINVERDRGQKLIQAESFKSLPGSPLSYWASEEKINLYTNNQLFENGLGDIKQGLASGDDFRFVRSYWEIPLEETGMCKRWISFAKGGEYQKYYYDLDLVVNWEKKTQEVYKLRTTQFPVLLTRNAHKYLYKPGLTYPQRTQKGFSVRQLPKDSIFGGKGPAIFPSDDGRSLYYYLGLFNSDIAEELIQLLICFGSYNEGYVAKLPCPNCEYFDESKISNLTQSLACYVKADNSSSELSKSYLGPFIKPMVNRVFFDEARAYLEHYFLYLYKLADKPVDILFDVEELRKVKCDVHQYDSFEFISYVFGFILGRWKELGDEQDLVAKFSTDIFTESRFSSLLNFEAKKSILMYKNDKLLEGEIKNVFRACFVTDVESQENSIMNKLKISNWYEYFSNPSRFFESHLKQYSKSRRQSPIYWPLQSVSRNITLWLNFHAIKTQSLLFHLNEDIYPRLEELETNKSTILSIVNRSREQETELEKISNEVADIQSFCDQLLELSKFWQPNHNDGVQITAAPLWRLFQHKPWQKKLKQTWEQLQEGEFDWAHLAFSTWPERVLKKCLDDRSLAIAHDVENELWHEVEVLKKNRKEPVLEWQPKPLSDAELHAYIREKIATDDRLTLYRSNQANNVNGGRV